ncbi:ABC transporter substrate-binding protein [Pseudaminobacter arsenicus]|uniref:ABC transporter substrate-binding protein n=2 Tax=Borborobacter arsenicus TaxID=1851146 RepID=A0A432V7Z2_9HYPH|nr:ABC transporter substrate-binding protein [Pseudaminobacter arsenicus]
MNSAFRQWAGSLAVVACCLSPVPNAFAQSENVVRMSVAADIGALPGVELDQALRDSLPASVRDSGTLRVATAAFTPPISFYGPNNTEIVGIAADLATAFGVMFGVDVEMIDLAMDSATIPAIKSGRFDMAIAGTNDTVERQQQIDFLDYMYDGKTIMVQQGNPLKIGEMKDLCGKTVAVGVGTLQEKIAMSLSGRCQEAINILSIPKQPDVIVAVRSGRADATINGYATSVYTTENQIQNGRGLEAIQEVREAVGYVGMVFSKQNSAMRDASQRALQKLIDSGGYKAIMEKWGLAPLVVEQAKINDAGSLPLDY